MTVFKFNRRQIEQIRQMKIDLNLATKPMEGDLIYASTDLVEKIACQ